MNPTFAVLPGTYSSKGRISALSRFLLLSLFAAGLVPRSSAEIDQRPVLFIGKHVVSSYQVDKNYQRFLDVESQTTGRPPNKNEIQAWFTRFIGQQILIGLALEQGFGERQEVQTEVFRMERHMLTQPEGPFYEKLFGEEKHVLDLESAYLKSRKLLSVEIIRIPLSARCAKEIAIDRISSAAIERARNSGAMFYYKGDLSWPYLGFEDLAPVLENTNEPKSWWQFEAAGLRVIARVISVRSQQQQPFDQIEAALLRLGKEAQKRTLRANREKSILAQHQFVFDWSGVEALLKQNQEMNAEIDISALASIKCNALATIKIDGTISSVTIEDYVAYHNALYLKKAPTSPIEVFSEVRDLIVAKQDYSDAIVAGVANQAKFCEDRANFRNYLALDLYEKEKVRPGIAVTEDQINKYYEIHRADYVEPTKIEGYVLSFKTTDEAIAFINRVISGRVAGKIGAAAEGKKIVLTKENIARLLPPISWSIATDSRNKVIGPLPQPDGGEYRVWQKESIVATTLQPLALMAPRIRAALEQYILDKKEGDLAQELSLKLAVDDHINYRRYGLNAEVVKPWPN